MRTGIGALIVSGLIGLVAAPAAPAAATSTRIEETRQAAAPVAVERISIPATGMRDDVAMVLIGTALIGLAAAVRRAA